ncbi:ribbon-helix-helix protein, CopG family [Natrinema versiforme]|uniref:ribbon-helix-helix protein, CopG family n=1 Tax=Natrinema versiforme TaxID=88724 RepID=UPI000A0230D3
MAQNTDKSDSYTFLQIRCESDFKENLRVAAAQSGKSMSEFVRETLQQTWEGTESEISEFMSRYEPRIVRSVVT